MECVPLYLGPHIHSYMQSSGQKFQMELLFHFCIVGKYFKRSHWLELNFGGGFFFCLRLFSRFPFNTL